MQRQLEAFMDQPRMRPLVKKLDCYINNTEPWTSIQELALRLPLVLGSSVSPAILPLRHLAFGSATLDSDTGELERLFSITEDTLTSISFEVSDQASAVLTRDQPFVTRLHISGKPRSLIFGLGAGRDDAPSNTLLDLLATILPHYPRLESLIIGPNNVPPSHAEGFTLAQKSRWAHQLDAEAFWSALPRTLKTLRLGCVVGRRAKVVMDYLDRAEASRAPLRVLGFLASEGLAVGIRCKELEIRFGALSLWRR